jgi:hypothetical protein
MDKRLTVSATALIAVEEFPSIRSLGAWMRVGDDHFSSDDIQRLYESDFYPRRRRKRKSS